MRYSLEQIKNFIEENSNCILLSQSYLGVKEKLLFKCLCGENFSTSFDKFKNRNKRQCNKCGAQTTKNKLSLDIEEIKNKVYDLVGNEYCIKDNSYVNTDLPIKMIHNVCEYEWDVRMTHFLYSGTRCPRCNKVEKIDTELFKSRVFELCGDEYIVLGEYENAKTGILIRHNSSECNFNEWSPQPFHFINGGTRCPICADNRKSKGEREISRILLKNNIKFKRQFTFKELKNRKKLRFDFAVFSQKENEKPIILIEYDGLQHYKFVESFMSYENFISLQNNDEMKNSFCEKNKIKLLRISYKDFSNLEKIINSEVINNVE